jgi:hypothetical protein
MSDRVPIYIVFNNRDQPVELYCGRRVVVVSPRGQVELNEAELAEAQIQALRDRGFITFQEKRSGERDPLKKEQADSGSSEAHPEDSAESSPQTPALEAETAYSEPQEGVSPAAGRERSPGN